MRATPAYVAALEAVLDAARPFGTWRNPHLEAAVKLADELRQPVPAPTIAAILEYAPEEDE